MSHGDAVYFIGVRERLLELNRVYESRIDALENLFQRAKISELVGRYAYLSSVSISIAARTLVWNREDWMVFIPLLNNKEFVYTLELYKDILRSLMRVSPCFKVADPEVLEWDIEVFRMWAFSGTPFAVDCLDMDLVGRIREDEKTLHFITSILHREIPISSLHNCIFCAMFSPCLLQGKKSNPCSGSGKIFHCNSILGLHFCSKHGAALMSEKGVIMGIADKYRLLDGRIVRNVVALKRLCELGVSLPGRFNLGNGQVRDNLRRERPDKFDELYPDLGSLGEGIL